MSSTPVGAGNTPRRDTLARGSGSGAGASAPVTRVFLAVTPTIVNIGYRSTNFWVGAPRPRVSSWTRLARNVQDIGGQSETGRRPAARDPTRPRHTLPLRSRGRGAGSQERRHATDRHAGAGGLDRRDEDLYKEGEPYTDIVAASNVVVPCDESRAFLATIGRGNRVRVSLARRRGADGSAARRSARGLRRALVLHGLPRRDACRASKAEGAYRFFTRNDSLPGRHDRCITPSSP